MKQVLSPTAVKTFIQCPRKYQATYVTKEITRTQNAAAARGEKLHSCMEQAIKKGWHTITWPDPVNEKTAQSFVTAINDLRLNGWVVATEFEAAIGRNNEIRTWWDPAPINFIRSKIDVCATHPDKDYAIVVDWKTGKRYDTDTVQLAINAMCLYPITKRTTYKMMFAYLDDSGVVEHSCTIPTTTFDDYVNVQDLHADVRTVYDTIKSMEDAEEKDHWPCKKNKFCRWCDVANCLYGV